MMQRSQPQAGAIVQEDIDDNTPYLTGDDFEFGWDIGLEGRMGISFLPELRWRCDF